MMHHPNESKVNLRLFNPATGLNRGATLTKELLWYITKRIFFLTTIPYPRRLKIFLLTAFGATVGKDVLIKPRVNIHMPWKLSLGNNVWIGEEVFILNFEQVEIGDNVCLSQRVFLCGGNHDFLDPSMSYRNGPIKLAAGCWIGAGSFVGPNVSVGVDTVVCAASVVSGNLNRNSIYKGNPAHFIKTRWQ